MNIPKLSMDLNMINTQNQYGVAMLDKNLETQEQLGASMIQMMNVSMMEQSVNPNLGSNIDIRI